MAGDDPLPAEASLEQYLSTKDLTDSERAWALAEKAHQVCPYSNATRGNIDVVVDVAQD